MAGNEWINSYLEAILDAGSSTKKRDDHVKLTKDAKFQQQQLLKEEKPLSTTRYFMEEVITSFDESDLYRTWIKVIPSFLTSHLKFKLLFISTSKEEKV